MQVNEKAIKICNTLVKHGFDALIVGGCVRDSFLGREPKDWDICTNASPDTVESLFKNTIPMGKAFGIITIIADGEPFEVATFRSECGTSDGRHPEQLQFETSIEADLSRRDFTMNAIAFRPHNNELVDPFNGKADIEADVIRFVGNAKERIAEDHLRVLRAFRFQSQLGFQFSEETWQAIKSQNEQLLDGVSNERIFQEMSKLLLGKNAAEALASMAVSGVLWTVIPELKELMIDHESRWHNETWEPFGNAIFAHVLHVVKNATVLSEKLPNERRLALMWSALLHDIGKGRTKKIKE